MSDKKITKRTVDVAQFVMLKVSSSSGIQSLKALDDAFRMPGKKKLNYLQKS